MITLTIRTPSGHPVAPGEALELLGDGRILASSVIDNDGIVTFDVSPEGVECLAVRMPWLSA
jgi:hypothetical protein